MTIDFCSLKTIWRLLLTQHRAPFWAPSAVRRRTLRLRWRTRSGTCSATIKGWENEVVKVTNAIWGKSQIFVGRKTSNCLLTLLLTEKLNAFDFWSSCRTKWTLVISFSLFLEKIWANFPKMKSHSRVPWKKKEVLLNSVRCQIAAKESSRNAGMIILFSSKVSARFIKRWFYLRCHWLVYLHWLCSGPLAQIQGLVWVEGLQLPGKLDHIHVVVVVKMAPPSLNVVEVRHGFLFSWIFTYLLCELRKCSYSAAILHANAFLSWLSWQLVEIKCPPVRRYMSGSEWSVKNHVWDIIQINMLSNFNRSNF